MEDDTKSDETVISAIQETSENSDIEYLLEKIKQFGKTLEQNHMEDATKSNETEMNPIQHMQFIGKKYKWSSQQSSTYFQKMQKLK